MVITTKQKGKIGIVGLGYVGLSMAILCAKQGLSVFGFDSDKKKVESLQQGISYISYISNQEVQAFASYNEIANNHESLSSCHTILVCVPTPLTPDGKPEYIFIDNAIKMISETLTNRQLIIIESTIECGITRNRILPVLENRGLQVGKDFFLAFSPERVDPGNLLYQADNTPKLVSGITNDCLNLARAFYEELELITVPVSSPEIAEMAKLLENTYRDVNIAFVNEMADVCHEKGVDIWQVIDAAASKPYGFQAFYPGPGVGGHCIPVDSVYYTYSARQNRVPALLAEKARMINAARPQRIIDRLEEIFNTRGRELSQSKLLVLGATYKKDVNDLRKSPGLEILELLISRNVEVAYHDPYIERIKMSTREMQRVQLSEALLQEQDCLVIAVGHSTYQWPWLIEHSSLIFDLTNVLVNYQQHKIIKL